MPGDPRPGRAHRQAASSARSNRSLRLRLEESHVSVGSRPSLFGPSLPTPGAKRRDPDDCSELQKPSYPVDPPGATRFTGYRRCRSMWRRSLLLVGPVLFAGVVAGLYDPPVLGRAGLVLLGLLITGLSELAMIVASVSTSRKQGTGDDRPADGEVPLSALCGVDSSSNEVRPAIKSFEGLGQVRTSTGRRLPSGRLPLRGRVALVLPICWARWFAVVPGGDRRGLRFCRPDGALARERGHAPERGPQSGSD